MIIGLIISTSFVLYIWLGENPLYHLAEGFYIGGVVALGIFSLYKSLTATVTEPLAQGKIILIIPVIIGLLVFARLTRSRWLSRFPVAIMSGIGIGIIFGLIIRSQIINVIVSVVNEVITGTPDILSSIYMFVGVIVVLTYFLYSARVSKHFHSPTGKMRYLVTLGRYALMASFGYLSGYIAMLSFGNVADFLVIVWKRLIEALMGLA